jgi:uncharacterized membrane protein YoaK (UPF0700 family)
VTAVIRGTARKHLRLWLMMALTFVTGLLDAVGYLGLDRVFTGNMTGNIVILGMGLAAEDNLPVLGPLLALGGYVAGAAGAGRLLRRHAAAWAPIVTGMFLVSACVLLVAGTVLAAWDLGAASRAAPVIAATIAMLMGTQAAAARALSVADMTTVVVTSTITAYASQTLFMPGWAWLTHRRLWAIVAIFAGALTGALLMKIDISVPVFVAAAVTMAVALIGHRSWG